ncbi:uncharacterized protein A4U43_C05F23990 [Asparagus officinalis]|uniref:Uncharacterized protein n=1 Tax=Asparagus officinalis TaxID=4686 RepID=A0A5P1EUR2_ASPOF|nr:uncharacterized protein A4U43_C05F23990 [Asparagus officinalis]
MSKNDHAVYRRAYEDSDVFPCLPQRLHVAALASRSHLRDPAARAGLTDPPPPAFSFAGPNSDDASPESSSFGSLSSDEEEDDDDDREAESKSSKDDSTGSSSLVSLSSLEDSLPIKKGLSSHFTGKSRSFSNLSECAAGSAGDLAKHENPFNKRRRIQIANKMSYKSKSFLGGIANYTAVLPPHLMPHDTREREGQKSDERCEGGVKMRISATRRRSIRLVSSPRDHFPSLIFAMLSCSLIAVLIFYLLVR